MQGPATRNARNCRRPRVRAFDRVDDREHLDGVVVVEASPTWSD